MAVDRAPKPFLLQLGIVGSLLFGGIVVLLLLLAPFDLGSYSISGETVSGPEFLRRAGLLFAAFGVTMLAVGLGLWLERAWTRALMMGYWAALILAAATGVMTGSFTGGEAASVIVESLLALALAGWYLYRKANVVAYYRRLERALEPAPLSSGSEHQSRGV